MWRANEGAFPARSVDCDVHTMGNTVQLIILTMESFNCDCRAERIPIESRLTLHLLIDIKALRPMEDQPHDLTSEACEILAQSLK